MWEFVCVRANVLNVHYAHVHFCVCVVACKCSSMPACSFLAMTTYQHCCVFDCQMLRAPAMASRPKDSHRPLEEDQSHARAESIVWQWQASWMAPWGTPPRARVGPAPVAPHWTCLSHVAFPPAVMPHHSQEHLPLMFLTLPVCCWDYKWMEVLQKVFNWQNKDFLSSHVGCSYLRMADWVPTCRLVWPSQLKQDLQKELTARWRELFYV